MKRIIIILTALLLPLLAMSQGVIRPPKQQTDVGSKTFIANGVTFKMIQIDGGTFQMGSNGGDEDERPIHRVSLSSYHIGETEVTQELWEAVMNSNPSKWKGASLPVESVNWNDCQTFIIKLNSITGGNFRLPTEAEWEFAARGGNHSHGYMFSGSNNIGSIAWYNENSNNRTHEVKCKTPNELGLYDMTGNVWEYCADWYESNYYSNSPQSNPKGPSNGKYHTMRGGGWDSGAYYCHTVRRSGYVSTYNLGFRLAL